MSRKARILLTTGEQLGVREIDRAARLGDQIAFKHEGRRTTAMVLHLADSIWPPFIIAKIGPETQTRRPMF